MVDYLKQLQTNIKEIKTKTSTYRDKLATYLNDLGVSYASNSMDLEKLVSLIGFVGYSGKMPTNLTLESDKSIVTSGESVTLTATLTDVNGNPIPEEEVSIVDSDGNVLYTGITDNLGKKVFNYTMQNNIQLISNFTNEYNYLNITSNTISLKTLIFEDNCSGTYSDKYENVKLGLGYYTTLNNSPCICLEGSSSDQKVNKIIGVSASNLKMSGGIGISSNSYLDLGILFASDNNSYAYGVNMNSSGFEICHGDSVISDTRTFDKTLSNSNSLNTFYNFIITIKDKVITLSVDNVGSISFTNTNMSVNNNIYIRNLSPGSSWKAYFNNLKIEAY
jgi:hypothetical protein